MARGRVVAAALEEVVRRISAGAQRGSAGGEEGDGAVARLLPFFRCLSMTGWPKHKRAALLEWRGYNTSSSSEQGGSHGQYTQSRSAASLPGEAAAPSPATASAGPARTAATAGPRTAGAVGVAPAVARLGRCLHPADLSSLRGVVVGGAADHRQSHDSQCPADGGPSGGGTSAHGSPRFLAPASVDLAAEPTLDARGNRALRSRRTGPSGRRRHRRRTSRQESLWQGASSRCRALVALVHGVSLRAQVGRVGRVGPFPVHQPAVGFAGAGGALSEQGPVGEATTQDAVAANAANAQGAVALVSRTYFRLCRRRRLRHARVGPPRGAAAVALDADQSFLRRCQSLRAAAGTHRSQDRWSTPRQRGQAAVPRKSRGPQPPAAASERGLAWRR